MELKILGLFLLVFLLGCKDYNRTAIVTKNIDSDSIVSNVNKGFKELCNKIPNVSLKSSMTVVSLKSLTGDEPTESGAYKFDQLLGQPVGKIVQKNFIVVFFSAPVSGDLITIQTYTQNGDEISRQNLLGSDGIEDLNSHDLRFESTGLKMDLKLNIYCYYKDRYVMENSKDTITKSFIEKYYKIDFSGKILEIN